MKTRWNPGDSVVLRGIVNERVWSARSVIVVKDDLEETILLLLPGAQCAYPEGYFRWKHGDYSQGSRWQEAKSNAWKFRIFEWERNRFLVFLEPRKYYAVSCVWDHETDHFACYYIDYQLPYQRSHCGFDTLDLDLDMVIDPHLNWRWKDEDAYLEGIREGGIHEEWVQRIEHSKQEVLDKIQKRHYPLDGSWMHWRPEAAWQPPRLAEGWEEAPETRGALVESRATTA